MSNAIIETGFEDSHDGDDWHVYPVGDTKTHLTENKHDCHCEPRVILDEDRRIYIHEAYDGRE